MIFSSDSYMRILDEDQIAVYLTKQWRILYKYSFTKNINFWSLINS